MGFFSGFSGEFGKQLQTSRAEEADRAERQSAMESQILQHLSTSPDPEIASHAITGLLDLAGPQKKAPGLAGWLGKVGAHPALPTIRQLVSQGRQVEDKGPVAPTAGVTEGLTSMPGTEVPVQGVSGPPAARQTLGPPSPDEATPSALTPPPAPRSVAGTPFQPATSKTVPRKVFESPEAVKGQATYLETQGKLKAEHEAWQTASPEERQTRYMGGYNQPIQHTTDAQGNVHFFQGGAEISSTDAAGQPKTPPRLTPDEAHLQARSAEILATNPGMTLSQATQQAQVEARAKTVATAGAAADAHLVRLGQIQAMVPATIAAWQRVNGTTPMTQAQAQSAAAQALSAASRTLGGGPNVTPEDIKAFANGLMVASDTQRGPKVSPIRAGQNQPLGGSPTTPPPGPITAEIPAHLQGQPVHPVNTPAQVEAQKQQATKVLSHVAAIQQEIEQIDQMGLLGPIGGRWGAFMASGVGALSGNYTPEQARLLAKFRTDMGLLKSGMAMVHGGARGGSSVQMMARMDSLISADKMDKSLLLGSTDAFKDWLGTYAGGPPGTAPAASASAVPPAVAAALKGVPAGKHTLSDGSVWVTDAAGHITKGG